MTLNSLFKEIRDLPADKLDEVYKFVHQMHPKRKRNESIRKKTLAFAGTFNDMGEKGYRDFTKELRKIRKNLFTRKVNL